MSLFEPDGKGLKVFLPNAKKICGYLRNDLSRTTAQNEQNRRPSAEAYKKREAQGVSLYSGAEREVASAGCLLLFVDVGQGLSFVLAGEGFEETLDFGDVVF